MDFHAVMHWIGVVAIWAAVLAANTHGWRRVFSRSSLSHDSAERTSPNTALSSNIPAIQTSPSPRRLLISLLLVALSIGAGVSWLFIWNHPGVALVLLGVVGENVWEAKDTKGKKAMYKFSAGILILGLVVEMFEAVQMDGQLTETKKEAAIASERAAKAELDLEKIKERYRHRVITLEQRAKFLAAVADAPKGPVTIKVSVNGDDTMALALSLRILLNEAGYDTGTEKDITPFLSANEARTYDVEAVVKNVRRQPAFAVRLLRALEEETDITFALHHSLEAKPEVTYENLFLHVNSRPPPQ